MAVIEGRQMPWMRPALRAGAAACGSAGHRGGGAGQRRAGRRADCVQWAARLRLRGEVAHWSRRRCTWRRWLQAWTTLATELLQAEGAAHQGVALDAMPVRMMLASDELRTVLVSIHVSLRDAIAAVTEDNVLQTCRSRMRHCCAPGRAPRIAVAGLNPMRAKVVCLAGRSWRSSVPRLAQLRAPRVDVHGRCRRIPSSCVTRHTEAHPGEFDVVIAMYHDQGLIPVKYLGVDRGERHLGLPLVRTSPDHGTAFDIAGRAWPMRPA